MSGQQSVQQAITRMAAAEEKRLGLPENAKFYSAFPFGGMDQQSARTAMKDQDFFWLENFIITGPAAMRTLWDRGTALYPAPSGKKIVYFAWFNIGPTQYAAVFLSDGTAVQVAQATGIVTTISAMPNTFYQGGQLPFAQQSGSQYLLISNNNTKNDYWIWDGTILYSAGSIGPYVTGQLTDSGAGYSSVPSYTVFGGSGSGVVLTPVVSNGSVVSLTIDDAGSGYVPGEIVQVAFSGGGSDTGPILQAVISTGVIQFITLVSGGSGYTNGTFALGFSGGGSGSGAAATFTVTGGVVQSINLTSGGANYNATPTLSFSASAGGSGATAVTGNTSGSVTGVAIIQAGSGLNGIPSLTIEGGGGSGATAVATAFGGITGVTVTNGGSGYTSTPAVIVGPGQNNAAAAILTLMPFGISGTSIETFLNRVWISNPSPVGVQQPGGLLAVSAPESLVDFATSDGGLLFSNSDRFLRASYNALRQSNGYLYTLGDSSASVINNVQTAGNPVTTTFNYQNASAQIGVAWRDTVQDFKQGILFANGNGIQGLYGGSVRTISDKVLNIFDAAFQRGPTGAIQTLPNGLTPSSAVANIHTKGVYLLLMSIIDPATQQQRNVMLGWDEKEWLVASQSTALIFIGTQVQNSVQTAWGTDGNTLFPLFSAPSAALVKTLRSKLYGGEREYVLKNPLAVYFRATDQTSGQIGVAMDVTMEATQMALQAGQGPFTVIPPVVATNPIQPNFTTTNSPGAIWGGQAASLGGTALGLSITSTSADFLLSGLSLMYRDATVIFD